GGGPAPTRHKGPAPATGRRAACRGPPPPCLRRGRERVVMTERARDLLKSVLRRAEGLISESSAGPEEASDPSAPPVVVVGLDSAVLNADSLGRLLGDLLERRRQELG